MVIGGNDKKKTTKLKRKAERNESRLQRMKKQKINECKSQTQASFDGTNEECTNSASDDEYIPLHNNTKSIPKPDGLIKNMTIVLPSLATAYNWEGVSHSSAAVLATLVLHDVGIVLPINQSKLNYRNKSEENAGKLAIIYNKKYLH